MPSCELVKMGNGELRGYGQENDRTWKRFRAWWKRLEAGEFFVFTWQQPRNPKLHRKFFALLNYAFEHWEPERQRKRVTYKGEPIEKNFEGFRKDLTILAGFYERTYNLKGRMKLEAKSIAFNKMTDDEFVDLYEKMVEVVRGHVLTNYTREDVDRVIAEIERFGGST